MNRPGALERSSLSNAPREMFSMELMHQIPQFLISGIFVGSIYALGALGFTLIYSVADSLNFAQGEFMMLGAMIAIHLVQVLHLPLAIGILIAIIVTAVIVTGAVRLCIVPKKISRANFLLVTWGMAIILKRSAMLVWGAEPYVLPYFWGGKKTVTLLGATIALQGVWIVGVSLIVVLGFFLVLKFTLTGRAMRACVSNEVAASLVGINKKLMVMKTFSICGVLGAISGVLIAPITLMSFEGGSLIGLKGLCAAVLEELEIVWVQS